MQDKLPSSQQRILQASTLKRCARAREGKNHDTNTSADTGMHPIPTTMLAESRNVCHLHQFHQYCPAMGSVTWQACAAGSVPPQSSRGDS